jgi:hypothetical protein
MAIARLFFSPQNSATFPVQYRRSGVFHFGMKESTLTAQPDISSTFKEWTGACIGTGVICNVLMDGSKSAKATFTSAPKCVIGGKEFPTLKAAYDDPATKDDDVFQLVEGDHDEVFTANRNIRIVLDGGYKADYSQPIGETTFKGPFTIKDGKVTARRIKVR